MLLLLELFEMGKLLPPDLELSLFLINMLLLKLLELLLELVNMLLLVPPLLPLIPASPLPLKFELLPDDLTILRIASKFKGRSFEYGCKA